MRHRNRAILADITNLGLDPKKNYTSVSKAGNLVDNSKNQKSINSKKQKDNTSQQLEKLSHDATVERLVEEVSTVDESISSVIEDAPAEDVATEHVETTVEIAEVAVSVETEDLIKSIETKKKKKKK